MTDLPPLPEAATPPYPIEEAPHERPTGPNGEPIRYAMDADEPEPVGLMGEPKALLGVAAGLALGVVAAIAATLFRRRQPEPKPAPKRRAARKPAARKPAARKSTRRTAAA